MCSVRLTGLRSRGGLRPRPPPQQPLSSSRTPPPHLEISDDAIGDSSGFCWPIDRFLSLCFLPGAVTPFPTNPEGHRLPLARALPFPRVTGTGGEGARAAPGRRSPCDGAASRACAPSWMESRDGGHEASRCKRCREPERRRPDRDDPSRSDCPSRRVSRVVHNENFANSRRS